MSAIEETDQPINEELQRKQWAERLQVFGSRLNQMVREVTSSRRNVEQRWLADIRQYNGKYAPEVESALKSNKHQSKVFINITRNKTNAAEARLSDMLFPTDDRNWGIKPTPRPELEEIAEQIPEQVASPMQTAPQEQPQNGALSGQLSQQQATPSPPPQPSSQEMAIAQAKALLKRAKKAAESMTTLIEDQLVESRYHAKCRDMIHDAVVTGTGVIKGPVVVAKSQTKWYTDVQSGKTSVKRYREFQPETEYISPWNFYPDPNAATIEEAEYVLESRMLTKRQVIDLAHDEHYLTDQLRKVLKQHSAYSGTGTTDRWRDELRDISELDSRIKEDRFELWEYNGPVDKEDLEAAGIEVSEDEFVEYYGTVHFIEGQVVRVALSPLEMKDQVYRVFNWEKDPSSIFGFGVPYMMRDQQKVMNASWRMTLDNAGVSAGPQIVVDTDAITPFDGNWEITSRKLWKKKKSGVPVGAAFEVYQINCNQGDLMNIFNVSRAIADEETSIPLVAQGESGPHMTTTAKGLDMLMNSANIVLRRAVKNFDDDVTRPHITSYYNWNMQFSDDVSVKGDFAIDARGSSALLAREMQQQRLLQFSQVAASNQEFAIRTDWEGLYKQIVRHMQISSDDVLLTKEASQQKMQEQASKQPQVDPNKQVEVDVRMKSLEIDKMRHDQMFQIEMANLDLKHKIAMNELALKEKNKVKELHGKLATEQLKDQTSRDVAAMKGNNEKSKLILQNENLKRGFDTF